jgi:hypothetical protein
VDQLARWTGRTSSTIALVGWLAWIAWRVTSLTGVAGVLVLVLEVAAVAVAVTLTAAFWSIDGARAADTRGTARSARLSERTAHLLGVDPAGAVPACGPDDTGEVASARRALELLDPRSGPADLATRAWALTAVEGVRRAAFVAALVAVLLTGAFPFAVPPWPVLALFAVSQALLAVGHWLLTRGVVRPGDRLRWSMASIGAGLGDGTSRSGLPIRWTATIATIVVVNVAVSLRGLSDRWTHGLGAMGHDERVVAMIVAAWTVGAGLVALRSLPQPVLGYYGATGRLEEGSTRRLALGATFTVAVVGLVVGVLPGGAPA